MNLWDTSRVRAFLRETVLEGSRDGGTGQDHSKKCRCQAKKLIRAMRVSSF